ncbi:MAG: hypothetical protein IPO97_12650 [Sphingomonadales bacterium]|nr:hypothetical protein [Sphingomonadales bacterium]
MTFSTRVTFGSRASYARSTLLEMMEAGSSNEPDLVLSTIGVRTGVHLQAISAFGGD